MGIDDARQHAGVLHVRLTFFRCARSCFQVERHNKPEIEAKSIRKDVLGSTAAGQPPQEKERIANPELICPAITITRSERECMYIEPAINSCRISIKIKQADDLERLLAGKFTRFLMQRAEQFQIVRKRPLEGYDITLLVTSKQLDELNKQKLIDFIIQFMEDVDKEISAMKLAVSSRSRSIATAFMEGLAPR